MGLCDTININAKNHYEDTPGTSVLVFTINYQETANETE